MDVVASLAADTKTPILMEPRKTTFNDPPTDSKCQYLFEPELAGYPFDEVAADVVRCRGHDYQAQKPDVAAAC